MLFYVKQSNVKKDQKIIFLLVSLTAALSCNLFVLTMNMESSRAGP